MDKHLENVTKSAQAEWQEIASTFYDKLLDYGTNDLQSLEQVIQRIREKLARVENIKKRGTKTGEPAVADLLDIAGYCVIGRLMEKGLWSETDASLKYTPELNEVGGLDGKIQVQRFVDAQQYPLPYPKKPGDVGYDLYTVKDTVIPAQNDIPVDVPTGVRVKLPVGHWALIINRSSTPRKLGIEVVNGVIDEGYTGELFACCYNRTKEDITVPRGTRLAQFLIFRSCVPEIEEVTILPATDRGDSGFGSTGL